MVQVFLEVHGDPGDVHEVRGAILLRSPVLVEDDRNLHSPLVRIDQGFRDRRGSAGVRRTGISCLASFSSRTTASIAPLSEKRKSRWRAYRQGLLKYKESEMSKQRKRLEEMIEEEEGVIEGHPSGTPIVCYEHYEGMKNKRKGSRFITSRMAR